MPDAWSSPPRLASARTVVRYVDEDVAILDVHFSLAPRLPQMRDDRWPAPQHADVLVEIGTQSGFHDEERHRVTLVGGEGSLQFKLVQPQRWWPAGMGDQSLYLLNLTLLQDDQPVDELQASVGLTSVRREQHASEHMLLVNGRECEIEYVLPVDRIDANRLLPASGHSLLIVRDHYGPDLLYDAADRAGIMLVQCVPIHPHGAPEQDMPAEVARLTSHPSLAGWCVGHLGKLSRHVARRIRSLDPTHHLFLNVPEDWAA